MRKNLRNYLFEYLKNNDYEQIKSKSQLLFSNIVDEIQKDKFYSNHLFFKNCNMI